MSNPIFVIDTGCMAAGKSQELYRRCSKYADALFRVQGHAEKVVLITYAQHQRTSSSDERSFSTHLTDFKPSQHLRIISLNYLRDIPSEILNTVSMIGIDEAFFPDLKETVRHWFLDLGKSICIASLMGDFNQEVLNPDFMDLFPLATKITVHAAYCVHCLKDNQKTRAYYTIRSPTNKEGGHGNLDDYESVCYKHLNNL